MSEFERTSVMNISIEVEGVTSRKQFKLYPGTEMVYAQGVDLAVTKALGEISKTAYDILKELIESLPEDQKAEVMLGSAVNV